MNAAIAGGPRRAARRPAPPAPAWARLVLGPSGRAAATAGQIRPALRLLAG